MLQCSSAALHVPVQPLSPHWCSLGCDLILTPDHDSHHQAHSEHMFNAGPGPGLHSSQRVLNAEHRSSTLRASRENASSPHCELLHHTVHRSAEDGLVCSLPQALTPQTMMRLLVSLSPLVVTFARRLLRQLDVMPLSQHHLIINAKTTYGASALVEEKAVHVSHTHVWNDRILFLPSRKGPSPIDTNNFHTTLKEERIPVMALMIQHQQTKHEYDLHPKA